MTKELELSLSPSLVDDSIPIGYNCDEGTRPYALNAGLAGTPEYEQLFIDSSLQ